MLVNTHEAKTQFSKLLEPAHAGQEIILAEQLPADPLRFGRTRPLEAKGSPWPRCSDLVARTPFSPALQCRKNRPDHVYLRVFISFAQVAAMQNLSYGSLRIGSRGPSVSALQSKLNAVLTPSPRLVADGVFGPKTAQAVRQFQQRNGLTADGVVGPKTAAALGLSLGGIPGGTPVPPPGGGHVTPAPPPGGGPPGFVDLSGFNVVVEALIGGAQKIVSNLLSWIDSDFVPQFVYDRAAGTLNGAVNTYASALRGITRQAVPLGQNPAVFVTGRMRQILSNFIASLSGAVQPLVGLPVIGSVASRYQALLGSVMSTANTALDNLSHNGQSAQATATRIAAIFESIARQIS